MKECSVMFCILKLKQLERYVVLKSWFLMLVLKGKSKRVISDNPVHDFFFCQQLFGYASSEVDGPAGRFVSWLFLMEFSALIYSGGSTILNNVSKSPFANYTWIASLSSLNHSRNLTIFYIPYETSKSHRCCLNDLVLLVTLSLCIWTYSFPFTFLCVEKLLTKHQRAQTIKNKFHSYNGRK